ncbi:MAG: hypothetical protein RL648_1785 [Verrucomicrobiota bacterium]
MKPVFTSLSAQLKTLVMLPLVGLAILIQAGCTSVNMNPIRIEPSVDLARFMGDWYVIACIPTFIEKQATNAVETYELKEPRVIATTFSFNKGGFDGPLKVFRPTGFVRDDPSNAVWGMQFIWPIKADYRIVFLDGDYELTIIGREKRDYVWIMARQPIIAEADYARLVTMVAEQGYDVSKLMRIPQQSLAERGR